MRLFLLTLLSAMLALPLAARADTITLDSANSSAGTYNYSLTISGTTELLSAGTSFTFSGLSGVTGASTTRTGAFSVSYTATSATFTLLTDRTASQTYADIFTIQSSVLTYGTVQYSTPSSPTQTSTVQGPVTAVTPEPSSLALLGTGVIGAVGVIRRRVV